MRRGGALFKVFMITTVTMGLMFLPEIESTRFEVASGSSKCVMEDIKINSLTVGKFSIINPNPGHQMPENHKVTVRVSSAKGTPYHIVETVESGTFAFTAYDGGDYTACFWVKYYNPSFLLIIDLDWKSGVALKDWSKVATKGQVEAMEIELTNMYDTAILIHDEMFNLRESEEEMLALNRATNSKMATFGFLSLFVCLSVAGLQLWHLKTFFERKKLL